MEMIATIQAYCPSFDKKIMGLRCWKIVGVFSRKEMM